MKITYEFILEAFPNVDILGWMGVTEGYEGELSEFISRYCSRMQNKEYLLGFLCNEKLMSSKDLRLFAVWCVRQIEYLLDDERSINALNIAEKFANGNAVFQELYRARDLAWSAWGECHTFNAAHAARAAAALTLWFPDAVPCVSVVVDYVVNATEFNNSYLMDTIFNKLIEYFAAKENNQEFSWLD